MAEKTKTKESSGNCGRNPKCYECIMPVGQAMSLCWQVHHCGSLQTICRSTIDTDRKPSYKPASSAEKAMALLRSHYAYGLLCTGHKLRRYWTGPLQIACPVSDGHNVHILEEECYQQKVLMFLGSDNCLVKNNSSILTYSVRKSSNQI